MTNLTPSASFDAVPQLETSTFALAGPGAPMNLQAQALLNRTQYLYVQLSNLAPIATSGDYNSLLNRPTLGSAAYQPSSAFATAEQGAKADGAAQASSLSSVAFSGTYGDLNDKPFASDAPQDSNIWGRKSGSWVIVGGDNATLMSDLASASPGKGSDLVTFIQNGAGAIVRTVQDKSRDIKHIKDYLATAGDGVTDILAALQEANAYLSGNGGGTLLFGAGIHPISGSYSHPSNVTYRGEGPGATTIRRTSSSTFCTALGANARIEQMTIDGAGETYPGGDGIVVPAGNFGGGMSDAQIINFPANCLHFNANGGSQFKANRCTFYTLGTIGTVGAVRIDPGDTASVPRHFSDCESSGCTLYDFTGSNDTFVTGGYTNGLIFGATSSKVFMSNIRIGAAAGAVTITGGSHVITNVVSAAAITINGTNHIVNIQAPNYAITDNSTGSNVMCMGAFTPIWGGSTANPAIGNGTLRAKYQRMGSRVSMTVELIVGSTTTLGTGDWSFSLPFPSSAALNQVGGAGFNTGSGTTCKQFNPRVIASANVCTLYYIDPALGPLIIGSGTRTWAVGDTLRFSVDYFCA